MIRVLVATPLGPGGNGGIDRLMDLVREEIAQFPPEDVKVRFAETRGAGSIVFAPLMLARFLIIMTVWRPHLVHINLASRGSTYRKLIVAWAAHVLGVGTVVHLHGALYRDFWEQANPRLSKAVTQMFVQARRVIVLGRVWHDFVVGRAAGATVTILPNATRSPSLPRVSAGDVRLLFLGRLGARKGSRDLVAALATLAQIPGWRATLAGDGELADTRTRVMAAGLSDRVEIPGWVGPERVAELLSNADVLILPSYDENLPMSVIEGMAAGLAIVATPVGAVEDILCHGESGLLITPGDVNALGHAIACLIDDEALRIRLGTAAAAVFRERLEIRSYVRRLVALWRQSAV